jgi:hypothetical protein
MASALTRKSRGKRGASQGKTETTNQQPKNGIKSTRQQVQTVSSADQQRQLRPELERMAMMDAQNRKRKNVKRESYATHKKKQKVREEEAQPSANTGAEIADGKGPEEQHVESKAAAHMEESKKTKGTPSKEHGQKSYRGVETYQLQRALLGDFIENCSTLTDIPWLAPGSGAVHIVPIVQEVLLTNLQMEIAGPHFSEKFAEDKRPIRPETAATHPETKEEYYPQYGGGVERSNDDEKKPLYTTFLDLGWDCMKTDESNNQMQCKVKTDKKGYGACYTIEEVQSGGKHSHRRYGNSKYLENMGKLTLNGLESRVNKLFNLKYGKNVTEDQLTALDHSVGVTLQVNHDKEETNTEEVENNCPLPNGIEFMEMHVVAILRNQGNGYHQKLHVDAPRALEVADQLRKNKKLHLDPWKVGYIMMIPLSREGLALRLLVPKDKETDDGIHFVARNIYVPYGTMIFIRADLFHSGCYGSCNNTRLHAIFVPKSTRGYDNSVLGWIDNDEVEEINKREFKIQQSSLAPHCMVPARIMLQHSKNVMAHISKRSDGKYWNQQSSHRDGPLQAGYMAQFCFVGCEKIQSRANNYRQRYLDLNTRSITIPAKERDNVSNYPKYEEEVETEEQAAMEREYLRVKDGNSATRGKNTKKKEQEDYCVI